MLVQFVGEGLDLFVNDVLVLGVELVKLAIVFRAILDDGDLVIAVFLLIVGQLVVRLGLVSEVSLELLVGQEEVRVDYHLCLGVRRVGYSVALYISAEVLRQCQAISFILMLLLVSAREELVSLHWGQLICPAYSL